jgi:hypothetical protein
VGHPISSIVLIGVGVLLVITFRFKFKGWRRVRGIGGAIGMIITGLIILVPSIVHLDEATKNQTRYALYVTELISDLILVQILWTVLSRRIRRSN